MFSHRLFRTPAVAKLTFYYHSNWSPLNEILFNQMDLCHLFLHFCINHIFQYRAFKNDQCNFVHCLWIEFSNQYETNCVLLKVLCINCAKQIQFQRSHTNMHLLYFLENLKRNPIFTIKRCFIEFKRARTSWLFTCILLKHEISQ